MIGGIVSHWKSGTWIVTLLWPTKNAEPKPSHLINSLCFFQFPFEETDWVATCELDRGSLSFQPRTPWNKRECMNRKKKKGNKEAGCSKFQMMNVNIDWVATCTHSTLEAIISSANNRLKKNSLWTKKN